MITFLAAAVVTFVLVRGMSRRRARRAERRAAARHLAATASMQHTYVEAYARDFDEGFLDAVGIDPSSHH